MLNDVQRNNAFNSAFQARIPAGSHVLDIGSGTGLLAMMAVRAGASHVTTCEVNPLLAEIAHQIIDVNGFSDRITVVPKLSSDLQVGYDMPRRAEVVVSEIVDCGLVGEGLLPSIRHAREHFLAPGGVMIPEGATLHGFLISSDEIRALNSVSDAGGFDVRLMNRAATAGHFPVRLPTWPFHQVSRPAQLARFDLLGDSLDDGAAWVTLTASADSYADSLVAWFQLDLGGDIHLSNAPTNSASHWMQALVPLPEPIGVCWGQRIELELRWERESLYADIKEVNVPKGVHNDEFCASRQ